MRVDIGNAYFDLHAIGEAIAERYRACLRGGLHLAHVDQADQDRGNLRVADQGHAVARRITVLVGRFDDQLALGVSTPGWSKIGATSGGRSSVSGRRPRAAWRPPVGTSCRRRAEQRRPGVSCPGMADALGLARAAEPPRASSSALRPTACAGRCSSFPARPALASSARVRRAAPPCGCASRRCACLARRSSRAGPDRWWPLAPGMRRSTSEAPRMPGHPRAFCLHHPAIAMRHSFPRNFITASLTISPCGCFSSIRALFDRRVDDGGGP